MYRITSTVKYIAKITKGNKGLWNEVCTKEIQEKKNFKHYLKKTKKKENVSIFQWFFFLAQFQEFCVFL